MSSRYYFLVGIFAGAGLLLVGTLFLFFAKIDVLRGGAYEVSCRFPEARGLEPGGPVLLVGVEVGKVSGVELSYDPEENTPEALVRLSINSEYPLYEGTVAYIRREGIIPSPYVNLVPAREMTKPLPQDGTAVIEDGRLAPSLEDVIARVDKLSENLNMILGEESFRDDVKETVKSLQVLASNGSEMAKAIQRLVKTVETEIAKQSVNVARLTGELSKTTAEINKMVETVNAIVASVEAGKGSLGQLVKKGELMGEMLETIGIAEQTLRELHELSRFLRRNPETLFWGRKGGMSAEEPAINLEDNWWQE
jgi:phospholipid/cholesterol/gamma-HCH transport system substrate-binding protein